MNPTAPKRTNPIWRAIFNLTLFSAYFYAFMEWLFFVTKPSSLSILSPLEVALVLVVTCGIVALPFLCTLLILFLPNWLARNSNWTRGLLLIAPIVPALALTVTTLVMFDNFTYTVFKFGIVSTLGWWRLLYLVGFGFVLWWTFRFARRTSHQIPKKGVSFLALGLLAVSTVAILVTSLSRDTSFGNFNSRYPRTTSNRPNIIILGSDGLSASYLSAYGYTEETTPFLSRMLTESLVAKNAFPNASSTTASTTSMLTGKEPATVGVYRYPDILEGRDSYEHLPGILKQYGYATIEIGTPYYVDAGRLNLLNGFDVVNSQSLNLPALGLLRSVLGNTPSTYFIWAILQRASERLLHIFFIGEMRNPLAEVTDPAARMTDEERVEQILDLMDQADRPVFVFAHLMDTHGPHFGTSNGNSSQEEGGDEEAEWDTKLYLDAIRGFDANLEKIYNRLAETGQLDNTILVIYTDHGYRYTVNQRIPAIIHFPNNAYAGIRVNNVQVIDIPATLLDYLEIPIPSWMAGITILKEEPPANREILSIVAGSPRKIAPPFYQIKTVQVIICHKWYALNVQENTWITGNIYKHTARCEEELLPSEVEVLRKIVNYLKEHNYEVSSIQQ